MYIIYKQKQNGVFEMEQKRKTIGYAFQSSLPIMAGYVVLGMGFGILLQNAGYSWHWAAAMSITIYAGSMQYVAVELLAGGASLAAAAAMTFFVNIRHLFYGISMLGAYKDTGKRKPYLIFALTDETFSLVCAPELPEGVDRNGYYLFLSLFNQIYWIIGSVAGAVLGNIIPFDTTGVDFAMTALFTVIFVEQWEGASTHVPALTGLVSSLVCLLLFGADDFLIPSMILIAALLFTMRGRLEGGELRD